MDLKKLIFQMGAGQGGGAVPFSPLDLSPVFGFDAGAGTYQDAAKTTAAAADGDLVGAWADQSGNGNDVTQGTDAKRFTLKLNVQNGKPGLLGNAVAQAHLSKAVLALAQPITIVAAFKYVSTAATQRLYSGGVNGYVASTGSARIESGVVLQSAASVVPAGPLVWTSVHNGNSSLIRVNGKQVAAGATGMNGFTGLFLGIYSDGATGPTDSYFLDFWGFAGISSTDIAIMENYLAGKYAINF